MSPRGSWGSVKELAFGVSYDTLVAPYATVAVEFDSGGGADGGDNDGTYFELGIEPGLHWAAAMLESASPSLLE
ncbi:MAG: hypothetical protein Ct9H300mP25_09260 [Acidobacteriota bacterium]|nr:MAG: hypothetical protein Ct9H300mP25_09260 [Acidobacteriota bacterium]